MGKAVSSYVEDAASWKSLFSVWCSLWQVEFFSPVFLTVSSHFKWWKLMCLYTVGLWVIKQSCSHTLYSPSTTLSKLPEEAGLFSVLTTTISTHSPARFLCLPQTGRFMCENQPFSQGWRHSREVSCLSIRNYLSWDLPSLGIDWVIQDVECRRGLFFPENLCVSH